MVYESPAVDDKKAPKTTEEEVSRWQQRISIAKKSHDDWVQESGAKRFCDEYKGKFDLYFMARTRKIPVPPVNEVFAYVQSDLASTYNRDPYLTVNPKAGTVMGSKLLEVSLNYEWRELKTKEEIELEIIDKDLVGYAIHKVGHTVQSEGTGDQLKILNQSLYSMRVDWRDVFWNVGSRRPPYDCQWMAQRIVRPLDDVKAQYPNAQNLKGGCHPDLDDETYKKQTYKDDIEVAVYYEIWDARTKRIYLVADGLKDQYLDDPKPWPSYLDEFPFLMYWDFAVPGSPRPMSAIAPWEPQILEEMVILAQAVNHAKRWNRQLIVKQGAIDTNALDKFERGDDGAIIENTGSGELSGNVMPLDFGALPTDFYQLMDRLQAIKRRVNGQPEFDQGGVTKTNTRTIGELNLIKSGAKSRTDRKVDRLETHLENIARHLLAHMKGNFDIEKVVKVSGETPEEVIKQFGDRFDPITQTIKFTDQEIQGEYDVEVKAGSTLPMDGQTKTQMLEHILSSVAQVVGRGPMSPFMNALIEELLSQYKIKSLQDAYKMEFAQAQEAQAAQAQQQNVDEVKTAAEAKKREAQATQIQAETEITMQEAAMGPMGRAQLERLKKPEPKPVANGV